MGDRLFVMAQKIFNSIVELPREQQQPMLKEACAGDQELMQMVAELLDIDDEQEDERWNLAESIIEAVAPSKSGPCSEEELSAAQDYLRAGHAHGIRLEALLQAAQGMLGVPSGQAAPQSRPLALDAHDEPGDAPCFQGLPRYEELGFLGQGGMGEVHLVRDRRLGRSLALKTIHTRAMNHSALSARFLEEAQATAQLQHPGIIPIYDMGELPDGRLWFTMKEVSGKTFGQVIAEVHAVSESTWQAATSGWTLRRLVDVLRQVCDAVGYAHSRGVVHRDLKPNNIMVGNYGEVMVLDWGLAKILGRPDLVAMDGELNPVQTDRSRADAHRTQMGKVAGTPAYMPPEQARGEVDQIDARSDVYALGAIIYELLTGRPPYMGSSVIAVLNQVRSGPPTSLLSNSNPMQTLGFGLDLEPDFSPSGPTLPPALVAICERAMARTPADRYPTAGALAAELQAWLDGDRRRDNALKVVCQAEERIPEAAALREHAATLRKEAAIILKDIEDWQPEEDKLPGWSKEDEAAALEKEAELVELEQVQLLHGSLIHAPDLSEAHAALAAYYQANHAAAEAMQKDTARPEKLLRQHLAALPEDHTDRIRHLSYLKGDGALTLMTDPPGAEVLLHRYVLHNRRLVPRFERSLGHTPLRRVKLPMGSYLCVLKHPGHAACHYPVSISRGEHWHGVPPNHNEPHPIALPFLDELGPSDCYIPAGWFACGGDPHQDTSLSARRVWVDGRVFRRFPVDNQSYIAFLDALVAAGRAEEALRHAPREKGGTLGEQGALIYGFDGTHFSLRPDAEGDQWEPNNPVFLVDWFGARAYCAWEATRAGLPWRLPGELAREKAARGVDGRFYPWGDNFDPSWACMGKSHQGRILPREVGAFPVDESPYGVRDMAGSIGGWCLDAFESEGPPLSSARGPGPEAPANLAPEAYQGSEYRTIRGSCWFSAPSFLRAANRDQIGPSDRYNFLGFRLARSYP